MSLKNIDVGQVLRNLADRRIEDAMKEGKFDNLAGAGQPLNLEPMPAGEDARMMWWCIKILRQNDFTPDEIRWRKMIDVLRDHLATATSERHVRDLVGQINHLIHKLNTLGTNAMPCDLSPINIEDQLRLYRRQVKQA